MRLHVYLNSIYKIVLHQGKLPLYLCCLDNLLSPSLGKEVERLRTMIIGSAVWLPSTYSQTSLIRTPKGQNQVSTLQRCPYYRGKKCMIFGISGTTRIARNREVSVRKG